ncbi:MAG: DNA sulfur modification protein DndB [Gammaproteobacteria bacterium]|nr:DNA sulfur modification protein DndB [Gammaproteobacteria bacterium]MCY4279058.1 DNA sulfur modification protein DndB [Gammaproteobacteria bacterium]
MEGYQHSFPALRGTQAGSDFFVAMCPMKLLTKIFVFDEDEVPPELRAQRTLNKHRIPEIARYLADNRESYVVSALTASVDTSVTFQAEGSGIGSRTIGTLQIPMDARLLINDGQHRRAAIEEAIKECPELRDDHVPVIFFVDKGLERSQQMFADLNKHAIRPSDSLSTLYDQRDPSSELARYVAMTVDGFKGMTEMEKSSISNRSTKLFTLSGIKHASRALLRKGKRDDISQEEQTFAADFWSEVVCNMPDWIQAKERKLASSDLRQNYVHAHGVALSALGAAGADLVATHPKAWRQKLKRLGTLDWSRSNEELWEGRAMTHGRISKAKVNIQLTANLIKRHIGLALNPEEDELERSLVNSSD